MAEAWQHVYNVKRPHFGKGMGGLSPLAKLQSLGYNHLDDNFSRFPVLLLDDLNPLLPGNNVLTMDNKAPTLKEVYPRRMELIIRRMP